jgi:hypothetical protein
MSEQQQMEEEAHFYFTIMEFEKLLEEHGAQFVLEKMQEDPFELLNVWFSEAYEEGKPM